jgi:hypothetical protein
MAEPVPGGLRPAAGPGGLTSPDPVTAPPRPSATRHHATHDPPARFPDEPAEPGERPDQHARRKPQDHLRSARCPGNDQLSLRGGLRLSEGYRRGEDYAFVSWDGYVKKEALWARSLAKAVRP